MPYAYRNFRSWHERSRRCANPTPARGSPATEMPNGVELDKSLVHLGFSGAWATASLELWGSNLHRQEREILFGATHHQRH